MGLHFDWTRHRNLCRHPPGTPAAEGWEAWRVQSSKFESGKVDPDSGALDFGNGMLGFREAMILGLKTLALKVYSIG